MPSALAAALFCLAACGGGGSGSPIAAQPATIRTFAYVDTKCHEDADTLSASQTLHILNGDRPVVTLPIMPALSGLPATGGCALFGQFRNGNASVLVGFFQRLGVSPDGSTVAFELNFDFTIFAQLGVPNPLTPDEQGIFVVRTDGSGLRRLGPPSGAASNKLIGVPSAAGGFFYYNTPTFRFSPDGATITFPDRGPGPAGEDADQVFTLNLATGVRHPITHLPGAAPPFPANPALPVTFYPVFLDDQTIVFFSRTNFDGGNPGGVPRQFTVKTDGTGLTAVPPPIALLGSEIVQAFSITRSIARDDVVGLALPGTPVNPIPGFTNSIFEVFSFDGSNLLQLTNFRRGDTSSATAAAGRVFFVASADPFGTNPSENCQVFSMTTLGSDLRQLTQFGSAPHSDIGCLGLPGAGCFAGSWVASVDPKTGSFVFDSTCDPLGTNPNGGQQIFAMHPDGTGLRQLTDLEGMVTAPDGSVDVELPGPMGPDN